jgi:polysaccharide pyruvyl transferase WcaK-like protein
MRRQSRTTLLEWTDDLRRVTGRFLGAECVIAMRLHAAVLACAVGRRCVVMPYDHKVVEFGRLMGLQDQISSATLDDPGGSRRVLEAALSGSAPQGSRACPDPWKTLSLAGTASRAVVA